MTSPLVLSDLRDGVLRLTLNDPATRNSLSRAMMAALREALDAAKRDGKTRVIVIGAEGPAFSSGHNLKEITAHRSDKDAGAGFFSKLMDECVQLMQAVVRHPRPIIAEINTTATAAGCQLVASCDLAIASEQAKFATPGVNIGLFCSTPMVALSRDVSRKHAMEMLLTGDLIDAHEAARIGLVNRVVPTQLLHGVVDELARKIASKSLATVKIGKAAFYRQAEMQLDVAYAYAARVMVENLLARDAEEGIRAFIDKRPPVWEDR